MEEHLYTTQVEDPYTGFIHNIEVWKIDDGYSFRIDWCPVNIKENLENL